jgi:transposase
MTLNKAKKNLLFARLINNARSEQDRDIAYTPLITIVVAMFLDRLSFVSFINSVIRWDEKQWKVSPGNLAKAIVLTPFLSTGTRLPLYAIYENFLSVDMSLLFEDHVKPEWLTRDAFACLLDRVYEAGCEKLFSNIALKVYSVFNIPFKSIFHGDTTTITLYGNYEGDGSKPEAATPACGYSKDGKPNLKQVLVGMITDAFGIPLRINVRDGNQNDSKWNHAIIDSLADLLKSAKSGVTYIADSKLTTAPNITNSSSIYFSLLPSARQISKRNSLSVSYDLHTR